MLTLDLAKPTRITKGLSRPQLAHVTGISAPRLRLLELRTAEPWFDEALMISFAFCLDGILPLITSGNLTDVEIDPPQPVDSALLLWRSTLRKPLSVAVTLAKALGLTDPADLRGNALTKQIWAVVGTNERHPEAPGWCPWCAADILGGEPHLQTCLPHNLWHVDETAQAPEFLLQPATPKTIERGIPAHGLKALRLERELRQSDVADLLGLHPNHYARIERAEVALSSRNAGILSVAFNVDKAVLYARAG